MATEAEALLEVRKSIIESKMAGKVDLIKQRALRDLDRMTFTDHTDFMSYVDECAGAAPVKVAEASEDELDEIMSHIFPGQQSHSKKYLPKAGEASEAEMDEIFKSMNI